MVVKLLAISPKTFSYLIEHRAYSVLRNVFDYCALQILLLTYLLMSFLLINIYGSSMEKQVLTKIFIRRPRD